MSESAPTRSRNAPGSLIFPGRWLQIPLYLGLIVTQGISTTTALEAQAKAR